MDVVLNACMDTDDRSQYPRLDLSKLPRNPNPISMEESLNGVTPIAWSDDVLSRYSSTGFLQTHYIA